MQESLALSAIQKKLVGKRLNYKEIYAIMDEISKKKLGDVLTTYFAASGYSKGFTQQELYFLTKAMVETGEKLHFSGIVADKHSIGGVPGTRTTLIVVPIVAAAGFTIPKSSSRAITTPGGTADDMEVIAKVVFKKENIYEIVKKTNGCIVWGGSFNIAPADDIIIQVEEPLLFESFDKILVSIMAKKIAFGSNHVVIDLPYGEMVKVHQIKDAKILAEKFEMLAKRFNIKIRVLIHRTDEPAGRGVGPLLETREAIRVLQQKSNRPLDLEVRSINLAGNLLELCLKDSPDKLKEEVKKEYGNCFGWATHLLHSGKAFLKMQEIIEAQGGNKKIDSEDLKPGKHSFTLLAARHGRVKGLNSKNLTVVAKILGAPKDKKAGIYLHKKIGEKVEKGDTLCTLYSQNLYNIKEGKETLSNFPVLSYER
ncbi:MAG TPA: thymidine phosphorylase [Candidatus Saccharimonadales bacterium]|nr:thymidine phosphorylase [Candidatus Saccharimonadales bacterium]